VGEVGRADRAATHTLVVAATIPTDMTSLVRR
jgi:hypothetical protein